METRKTPHKIEYKRAVDAVKLALMLSPERLNAVKLSIDRETFNETFQNIVSDGLLCVDFANNATFDEIDNELTEQAEMILHFAALTKENDEVFGETLVKLFADKEQSKTLHERISKTLRQKLYRRMFGINAPQINRFAKMRARKLRGQYFAD